MALLGRLLLSKLARRYPVLTAYLVFTVLNDAVLIYLQRSQTRLFGLKGYNLGWVVTRPILWAFLFLVVLELYSRMLEEFSGIRRLGRLVLYSSLGGVTLACAVVLAFDGQPGVDPYPVLSYMALQERSVFLILSALMALLLLFVGHYRLEIRGNVLVLVACFGVYFLASAVLVALRWHFGDAFKAPRNTWEPVFYSAAVSAAALLFSRAGETRKLPAGALVGWPQPPEPALAAELRNFNQVLARVLQS